MNNNQIEVEEKITTATEVKLDEEIEGEYEVESILSDFWDPTSKTRYYLIKWKGYADQFNCYEPSYHLRCPLILKNYKEMKKEFKKLDKTIGKKRKCK